MRWPAAQGRLTTLTGLRLLIAAYFVVLVVITATTVPTLVDTLQTLDREQAVYDTTSTAVSDLLIGALNQETGVRGYALGGQQMFLQPVTLGRTQYDRALARLRRTDLGPTFSRQVEKTAAEFTSWRVLADQIVADVGRGDLHAARALVEQTRGKDRFDEFRAAQSTLAATVHEAVRSNRQSLHQKVELSLIILGAAVAFGGLVGVGILLWWRIWGRRTALWERSMTDQALLLQAAIDASSDSIFAKDATGRHILSNRARAAALTRGDHDAELVGHTVEEFLSPEVAGEIRAHEDEVMRSGTSSNFEETLPQPDGTHVYAVTKSPLRGAGGEVVGIVGVARDVTAERALLFDRERLYQLEHQLAVTLQEALLGNDSVDDDRVDACTRYIPAGNQLSVGGDWYDLFQLTADRVGLVVGDAVGHGVDSVTAMGQLRSALAALVGLGLDPGATLEKLDLFARQHPGGQYATCLYAVLDLAAAELTYSTAGQMPPALLTRDRQVTLLDRHQDPPLAVPNEGRRTHSVHFPVGSTILLYTDGLVERRREDIDAGLRRLVAALHRVADAPVGELCDSLIDELLGTEERRDDVAMVAVRYLKGG
jgi:PAS domain S-box-containing protein